MKQIGQLFVGLITAIASSLLVLAVATLSLVEGEVQILPAQPSDTPIASPIGTTAFVEVDENTSTPTALPTATPACAYPEGWVAHIIRSNDTLASLAEMAGTSDDILYNGNCLENESLIVSSKLYLPPTPSVTPTSTSIEWTRTVTQTIPASATPTNNSSACVIPSGWVPYIVKPGDNLFQIGLAYGGISSAQLIANNCLRSETIRAGQRIFVPNVTPRWPTARPTPTQEPPPPPPEPTEEPLPTEAPTDLPTELPTDPPSDPPTEVPTELPTDPYPPPTDE